MPATVDLGVSGVEVRTGDHVCAFYRGAERDQVLIPFLQAGLRDGDKCICVVDGAQPQLLLDSLDDPLVDQRLERHQLELLASEEVYLAGGEFVLARMVQFWDDNVSSALEDGAYRFVRSVGEMTWALRDVPGVEDLLAYEARVNQVLAANPDAAAISLCLYDVERFDAELIVGVLRTHPKVVMGGTVIDNPFYIQPEEFLLQRN